MESKPDSNKLKGDFSNKLSRYSAVMVGGVVGTMAAFESTEAAMIVTNTVITLIDNPGPAPAALIDLDGDAANDIQITVAAASLLEAQGLNGGLLAGTVGGPPGSFFYPTAFQAPSTIGPALGFSGNSTQALNTFGTLAMGTAYGNWAGVTPTSGYVGVKFQIAGSDHYGWVHVTWDPTSATATIDQYAYNSDIGAPALVPEPSPLTLLGLGALGLAARRRRRESESAG